MANFKKGDQVRQIVPAPIVGNVTGFTADQETGVLQICVEFQENGETRTRYFDAEQIEAVPAA
jgi:hypothetical protein